MYTFDGGWPFRWYFVGGITVSASQNLHPRLLGHPRLGTDGITSDIPTHADPFSQTILLVCCLSTFITYHAALYLPAPT
jgi:hypothetical protein